MHGARFDALGEPVGLGDVARPDTRGEAVDGVVGLGGQIVEVGERHRGHDWAEDLLLDDSVVGGRVDQDGRLDEEAGPVDRAAAGHRPGAFVGADLQVAGDPVELLG